MFICHFLGNFEVNHFLQFLECMIGMQNIAKSDSTSLQSL